MTDKYIEVCAAINHAHTHGLALPREWLLLKKELKQEWCRVHSVVMPAVDTVTNLRRDDVSDAERQLSAAAYTNLMLHSSKLQDEKQVPWWDFFLKVQ